MTGPRGFTVKEYDATGVEGTSSIKDSGVVVFTASEDGTIDTWIDADPKTEPADGGIPVKSGDRVVFTPTDGGYSIQVVKA